MKPDPGAWDLFADIAAINAWLDRSNAHMNSEHDDSMRVMKIGEEIGEVHTALSLIDITYGKAVAAYIGFTGQNPRKGQTHTRAELLAELADVAVTALAAIQHFTGDSQVTRAVMASKVSVIMNRVGLSRANGSEIPALIAVSEITRGLSGEDPETGEPLYTMADALRDMHLEPCKCGHPFSDHSFYGETRIECHGTNDDDPEASCECAEWKPEIIGTLERG